MVKNATKDPTAAEAKTLGFAVAFFKSDPDLYSLFQQAVKNTWTADKFTSELENSDWWTNHADSFKTAVELEYSDPKEYQRQIADTQQQITAAAQDLGVSLDSKTLGQFAQMAYRQAWTDTDIAQHLGSLVKEQNTSGITITGGGNLASWEQELNSYSQSLGLGSVSNTAWNKYANQLSSVDPTQADAVLSNIKGNLATQAEAMYPNWSKQIAAGQTMDDITAPYKSVMQDILEIPSDNIKTNDATLLKGLGGGSPDGKSGNAAMSLTDFSTMLRQDPRWQTTNNAVQAYTGAGEALAKAFGVIGQ